MLEALRDISEPLDPQSQPPLQKDTLPPPPIREAREKTPTPTLPSIDTTPIEVSRESDTEPSTPSVSSSSRMGGSENGGETEEDEGMVLVGRPDQK